MRRGHLFASTIFASTISFSLTSSSAIAEAPSGTADAGPAADPTTNSPAPKPATATTTATADGHLTVLYHADLDGRLASPRCGRPGPEPPNYAALVGQIAAERTRALSAGRAPPVVLLGGNQLAPALFTRSLLSEDRGAGAAMVAALLARGSYDAVALGHHDLSIETDLLDAQLRQLTTGGLPIVASNVRCDAGKRKECSLLRPDVLVDRGAAKIGILATISPAVVPGIPADRMEGMTIEDPATAIRAGVRRLRARGATHVLVMTQGPRDGRALDEIEVLMRGVEGGATATAAPDLILAGGLTDEEGGRALRLYRRAGAPPVVGSAAGTQAVSRVVFPVAPRTPAGDGAATAPTAGLDVDTLVAGMVPTDDATESALRAPTQAFCLRYGSPLAPRRLGGRLTRDEFTAYVLEVMRREAGAEIALINRGAVRRSTFPVAGSFTQMDLHDALPFTAIIGVARVTGPTVETVLGSTPTNPKAALAGLRRAAGGLEVNGRPLDKARAYRVATINFVATGGDAIVPAGALPWSALPHAPELRATVEKYLRQHAAAGAHPDGTDGDGPFSPKTAFGPGPNERLLLVGLTDIGLDLTDTAISNPQSYGDSQLSRAQQTSFKGDATVIVQMRLPRHQEDTRLNLKYGWARTRPAGTSPAVSGETADLITFTSVYTYRGLRDLRSAPRRLVPDPYVRLWAESELTRPAITATQTRDFHHLQAQATAGALFTLTPQLKLRGGTGARRELLASGDAGRWQAVFEAGATLDPTALATLGALAIRLEGLINYDLVDPGQRREQQVRAGAKISVPLLPLLFVTAGLDVYAVERQTRGWARSYDTTVGLRLHLDAAYQKL